MFDSNNFTEIGHLNFDSNFSIDLGDKIKIILGPNGTGKSSIYKNIKQRHNDYAFIDYEDIEDSIIGKKDNIVIGASIVELTKKNSEKQSLLDAIDIKGNLKNVGITNPKTAKSISDNMEVKRKNLETAILQFNNENLDCIFEMSEDNQAFFLTNAKRFIEAEELQIQVEELKDSYRKKVLEEINNFLDNSSCVCPVCGHPSDEPIKKIVNRKISEIREIENEIIKNYQDTHSDLKPEEIMENLNSIKNAISENNITIKNVENYCLCGGNSDKAELIMASKQTLSDINERINELEVEKEQFYNNLKLHKEDVISTFKLQFSVEESDISFDDIQKTIKIKLRRNVETYSTGEINLMTFIICILEFISSDKTTLVIDDPLSSYDIPNQYRIIYEITSSKKDHKNILIFTHNIDTINIANSQYSALFEYEIIEKKNNTLFLNSLPYTTTANVLSAEKLMDNIDNTYVHFNYLKLLLDKDSWEETDDNHLIFHYDSPFSKIINGVVYTNDYLVNLIDNFNQTTFQNESYLNNTANKIIYNAAIRAWVEKQFYDNLNGDENLNGKLFGQKVTYVFSGNRWTGSSKVTKEYLMSKKVMLNQQVHSKSQKMPFYYSLNLTFDDITKEIIDIKNHFIVE